MRTSLFPPSCPRKSFFILFLFIINVIIIIRGHLDAMAFSWGTRLGTTISYVYRILLLCRYAIMVKVVPYNVDVVVDESRFLLDCRSDVNQVHSSRPSFSAKPQNCLCNANEVMPWLRELKTICHGTTSSDTFGVGSKPKLNPCSIDPYLAVVVFDNQP